MKTLILILLLAPVTVMAFGVGGHASAGHASAHVSAHPSSARSSVSAAHVSSSGSRARSMAPYMYSVPIFVHGQPSKKYHTTIHEPSYWYFLSKCKRETPEDCE